MKTRMRVQRGIREAATRELVTLGPEVAERMALAEDPDAAIVRSYMFTRAASRAWEAINSQLTTSQGALFWIGGAAGAGKTHFLNYLLALSARAGSLGGERGRHLTFAIDVAGRTGPEQIDRRLLELIATALAGESHAGALWREMRAAEALAIAFDTAKQQGVSGVTVAIDLGPNATDPALEFLVGGAQLARSLKGIRLILVVAGRGDPPAAARAFDVAAETDEQIEIALGRARQIEPWANRAIEQKYRGVDIGSWEPSVIYPLHPSAAVALRTIAQTQGVGPAALMAREAITSWREEGGFSRLIMPSALMKTTLLRAAVETRLGETGCAALAIAYAAGEATHGERDRAIAHAVIDTLLLAHLSETPGTLELDELHGRVRPAADQDELDIATFGRMISELATRSRGAISFDAALRVASFNPRGAGAPEVSAFNAALPLVRCFDSTLTTAQEMPELSARLKRLGAAMASALEGAYRNREILAAAMREIGVQLSAAQQETFTRFIEIAESGPEALVETGADESRRAHAMETVAAYERLAMVAGAVPRLRLMREYLDATQLQADHDENPSGDRNLAALEAECQVLKTRVTPAALAGTGRNLDALEATFQKFKWTYVQFYRPAHEHWRQEMARLMPLAEDTRRHIEALRRLNEIVALGAPEGAQLGVELAAIEQRMKPCSLESALSPEVTPCCARCGFVLGMPVPREELQHLFEQARRALQSKLATISHSAIARLIQQHDRSHRLEGFLRITQAAQTDALIRVLDDRLAHYLAQLLDERPEAAAQRDSTAAVHAIGARRLNRTKVGGRGRRALKLPPPVGPRG